VHFGDGFVDAVLVLLSLEAVVLDVIDEFQEEHAHESVMKLVLK